MKRRDGRGLATEEEVAMWRSIMAELYGEPESGEEEAKCIGMAASRLLGAAAACVIL